MSLAASTSEPSRPPQKTYVRAPSSAARSRLRITLRIAKRRTERSLEVKPPSRKTGCVNRFVVTIGTTTPVSASAPLKRSMILSRSGPDVPNGIRSSSWNVTPHAPSSARRWTVSTGSSGGRVGSPNGSCARQPTVHRPNENLLSGVALVLIWSRVSRLGHDRRAPGPPPAGLEVRLAGVLLRRLGGRVDRQPGQPADRQGRRRDRDRRPRALAGVPRPALRQRPRGRNEQPDLAVYAQHAGGESRHWAQVDLVPGTQRPIVYVARGSHASYF